jgi:hypothetical protein
MYECSQRLKREINGIESLKRQEKCLLACLNILKLVDKKYAWIAVIGAKVNVVDEVENNSKHHVDAKLKLLNNMTVTSESGSLTDANLNVDIVDYDEINRGYLLVHYMIKLSSIISSQNSIGIMEADLFCHLSGNKKYA